MCVCVWQTDVYCMCHSIFVQCHLSLLFPVNHILHVSLSIDNAHVAILYIVKIRLQNYRCVFRKSIKGVFLKKRFCKSVLSAVYHSSYCQRMEQMLMFIFT